MQKESGKRLAGGKPDKQPKPPKEKKPSRLTVTQKVLLAIAIVLAVAIVIVLAWQSVFSRPDIEHKKPVTNVGSGTEEIAPEEIDYGDGIRPKADGERKSKDYYTVLILGRDTGGGGNTDTMLLASYDVTNQKAAVMSIPRDTMVNVPWDVKKINSVYSWYGGGDAGIQAVYKEIAQLVGFEPDFQVVVEWDAIGEIVEAMDGVYFDVPYNMNYHDPFQDLVIEQAAGYRLLNGDDAMQVIRWRHNDDGKGYPDSDLGRIKTQQNFLKAVIKQLLQLKNVTKIGEFVEVFKNNVETDMSFQEILWFGQQAVMGGLQVENVTFTTMPNKIASAYSPTVSKVYGRDMYQSYVVPKANELLDLVNHSLSPFVEESTLSDLDIMSVNRDGSVSSSTGYVEDKVAAKPPVKIGKPETETPTDEPQVDENGNIIDPETGEIIAPPPESIPGIIDPNTQPPETQIPGVTGPSLADPEPTTPESGGAGITDPGTTMPEETVPPVEPQLPPEIIDPNISIIEPPPAI